MLKLICINQFSATCSSKYIRGYNFVPVEPAVNNCYYLGSSLVRNCCAQLIVFYSYIKSFIWQFQFVTKFCKLEIQVYILCLACRPLSVYYIGVGVYSVHSEFGVEHYD